MQQRQEEIARLTKELAKATQNRKRARILNELGEIFYISDPVVALDYAERAFAMAAKSEDAELQGNVLTLLGRCKYRVTDFNGARENFKEALSLHTLRQDEHQIAKLLYLMGNIHLSQSEYSQAITYYNNCIELAERLDDKPSMEIAYNNLGIVFRRVGDLQKAFDYHSRSLMLTLELGLEDIGPVYLNLAIMYYEIRELEKAIEYFDKANEAARQNNNTLCIVMYLISKGDLLTDNKEYPEAIRHFTEAIQMSSDYDFHADRAKALERLGALYTQTGERNKALQLYNEALLLCEKHEIGFKKTNLLLHKAQLLFQSGNKEEAKETAEKGMELATANGEIPALSEFYRLLAQSAKEESRFEEAVLLLEKYGELRDEIHRSDEQKLIREAHIRLEVEAAMREHVELKLQKELLEQNLSTKNQELTALALQLSKQNEALGKVTTQLKDTLSSNGQKSQAPVNTLISEIERLRNSESDWEFFTSQFNAIHADFGARLLEKFPALSPKEMKVCLLMKLNLSTKDIANSLCLSNRTVEVHRYQIRKKIGLAQEENLHNFLSSLN